jgi:hypothetical protein
MKFTLNAVFKNLQKICWLAFLVQLAACAERSNNKQSESETSASKTTDSEKLVPDDLCVTEFNFEKPGIGLTELKLAPKCKDTKRMAEGLKGYSIFYSAMAVVCGIAPEPLITKGTAALFIGSSTATTTLSFLIEKMECEGPVELDEGTKLAIEKLICEKLGKKFDGKDKCLP